MVNKLLDYIPHIAVIIGAVWSIALLYAKVAELEEDLNERTVSRYHRYEAEADFRLVRHEIEDLRNKFDGLPPDWLKKKIDKLEDRVDRLERK